jgi:hypothetical protein
MRANPRPRQTPEPESSFEEFEAASLFCPTCRQAVAVRKRLLLILPEGDKYDYICVHCGTSVGSKLDCRTKDSGILL